MRQLVLQGLATTRTRAGQSFVDRVTMVSVDRSVGQKQLRALECRPVGDAGEQDHPIGAGECLEGVARRPELCQHGKRAVEKLHLDRVELGPALRRTQQAELDRLVWPEHGSRRDPEEQRVADLSGGAGHGNPDRFAHERRSFLEYYDSIRRAVIVEGVDRRSKDRTGNKPGELF